MAQLEAAARSAEMFDELRHFLGADDYDIHSSWDVDWDYQPADFSCDLPTLNAWHNRKN